MYRFKKYLILCLLSVFVLGALGATSMAYCGPGNETSVTTDAIDTTAHHDMAQMNRSAESADNPVKYHNVKEVLDHSSSCYSCLGSFCHSQSLLSLSSKLVLYSTVIVLHAEQDISHKSIFFATIPQPPKQLA